MLLADTMAWVFAIFGLLLSLPGLWLLCRGLWPEIVERTTIDCNRGLLVPLLVGIPLAAILVGEVSLLSKLPEPWKGVLTILAIAIFLLFASTGIAGLATVVGQRLPSPTDSDRPWKATIRGGVVLELAFLVPVLGWFLLLPLSLILGSGAALRAIIGAVSSKIKPKAPPATAEIVNNLQFDGGALEAST